MFGSKLRSWMENHIRPRKKGNKNKNSNGAACDSSKKSGSSSGNPSSSNGSSTLLPYSTHSSGCNSVISSPVRRREVSPIQNHTPSRYGWQSPNEESITSPKSDNFLYAPQHHRVKPQLQQNSSGNCSKEHSFEDSSSKSKTGIHADRSTSSFSSLTWSTGSKESSINGGPQNNNISHRDERNYSQRASEICVEITDFTEDPNEVHYEEIGAILRYPLQSQNHAHINQERPKSEQLMNYQQNTSYNQAYQMQHSQDDVMTRYGRILPSKMHPNEAEIMASPLRYGSAESISHRNGTALTSIQHKSAKFQQNYQRMNGNSMARNSNGLLRAGVPNATLPSPESAYSTGYSTDGTSPSAVYTPPEYYINMRSGTHYFPKNSHSLAIETKRYKFGLNKIEEMSPLDPQPKTSFASVGLHSGKRSDVFENQSNCLEQQQNTTNYIAPREVNVGCHSPLAVRNKIVLPTLKGFESPSPRQRPRIRTNPWYSTCSTEASSNATIANLQTSGISVSSSTTLSSQQSGCSSVIRVEQQQMRQSNTSSSNSTRNSMESEDRNRRFDLKLAYKSSDSSSSLTEMAVSHKSYSPQISRIKRAEIFKPKRDALVPQESLISDEDTTLNEMMGKFDESYIYEKETDILSSSDSDPTDVPSDLDTGLDAGDECDTDELLDIDFIDTASMQEVVDWREKNINFGSCNYYYQGSPNSPVRRARLSRSEGRASQRQRRNSHNEMQPPRSVSVRRKKRFMKTRKKSLENKEKPLQSIMPHSRESRSVGGTPVCMRKNLTVQNRRVAKASPLSNRSSSLVFTEPIMNGEALTIAESKKALLKADLEADLKYRELIQEAESILVSLKNSMQSIPRDTPLASPRRLNPLANKRVEMLKHYEVEAPKRSAPDNSKSHCNNLTESTPLEHELTAAINKRIELLKHETTPHSTPKMVHRSPRKTHLTNFMNQNAPTEMPIRKAPNSPVLQLNGRQLKSPNGSPSQRRRRLRSQSPQPINDSDSEMENLNSALNGMGSSRKRGSRDEKLQNIGEKSVPYIQRNDFSCPQSEPLKRKVYKGSSTFEKIKQNFDLESEIPKQTILAKIHHIRREHNRSASNSYAQDLNLMGSNNDLMCSKKQLILNTLADIKRNLESQSVELNGLNED